MLSRLSTNSIFAAKRVNAQSHVFMRRQAATFSSNSSTAVSNEEVKSEKNLDDNQQPEASELGRKLKPRQVVEALDSYIVGQSSAKRAVAIALRNRWRRQHVSVKSLRAEVSPKNILMIGPTGCGKTEIARRLAKLSQAPFVKVEATKFTEVGFHGRDVDSIMRDLVENSISMVKASKRERLRAQVQDIVESKILDGLTGSQPTEKSRNLETTTAATKSASETRASFLSLLRSGELETRKIPVDVPASTDASGHGSPPRAIVETFSIESASKAMGELSKLANAFGGKSTKKIMTVAEARPILEEAEMDLAMDLADVTREAIVQTEENGIVFIDEIDKVCSSGDYRGADASSEGVQRDLLPLIEGSVINTKHGNVNTEHILFIASGAFHVCKPAALLAELQGRLPIRVELDALSQDDLYRILTEPVNNLIFQQQQLLKTEGLELEFPEEAIREVARVAFEINRTVENIGARRLHTVLERVVEQVSFDASEMEEGSVFTVTPELVQEKVGEMLESSDLSKFIL